MGRGREEAWTKGEREEREREGRKEGGRELISSRAGSAQALCEQGWLPIDWKTASCGRTDKGGCGLTGEGRDTDQSYHHTTIFLSLILPLSPWNECSCSSSVEDLPHLRRSCLHTKPETISTAGNLLFITITFCSSCSFLCAMLSPDSYEILISLHPCLVTMVSSISPSLSLSSSLFLALPHSHFFLPLMS